MDKKTAELLLNTKDFDSPFEAYEHQLFHIRKTLIIQTVVPSLLYKKIERLHKLSDAYTHFDEVNETIAGYELKPFNGENLLEKFICYEQNKSLIKQHMSKILDASHLEQGILRLIDNLALWAKELKDLKLEHIEVKSISKELDSMTMLTLFNEIDKRGNRSYLDYDIQLLKEFRRIQILSETINA